MNTGLRNPHNAAHSFGMSVEIRVAKDSLNVFSGMNFSDIQMNDTILFVSEMPFIKITIASKKC